MSSFDRTRRLRRGPLVALAAAVMLAACSVQPLYGPDAVGRHTLGALDRITIDPVHDRVAQQVRNKLVFDLNDRQSDVAPTYRMTMAVSSSEIPLGVTPVESTPASNVTVTATYTITPIDGDEVLLRETVRGSASYDLVNQSFANTRARLDAQDRAAAAVANDIRIRLAAAATQGVI